jgi:hypothetical protein
MMLNKRRHLHLYNQGPNRTIHAILSMLRAACRDGPFAPVPISSLVSARYMHNATDI